MAASASEGTDKDVGAPLPGREALRVLVRVRPRNEAEESHIEVSPLWLLGLEYPSLPPDGLAHKRKLAICTCCNHWQR
jgi:hypothetical protein